MTKITCPKCGGQNVAVARNMKGTRICPCGHRWDPPLGEIDVPKLLASHMDDLELKDKRIEELEEWAEWVLVDLAIDKKYFPASDDHSKTLGHRLMARAAELNIGDAKDRTGERLSEWGSHTRLIDAANAYCNEQFEAMTRAREQAEQAEAAHTELLAETDLAIELAWGIICNASDHDLPGRETWIDAARRWGEEYMTGVSKRSARRVKEKE